MRDFFASVIKATNEKKRLFEKLGASRCFDVGLSEKEMRDPVVLSMLTMAEAMGGGFDIMKKVYEEQRTTPKKKNQNKKYYTDGFNIMRKWQRNDTSRPFKETQPIKEDFSIMKQIKEHPVPIKKEKKKSLMEPIEVDPPPPVNNKYNF